MDSQQTQLVNIGSKDRQIRITGGIILLAMGVALAAYFFVAGVTGWWRALVFIPFELGLLAIFEGQRGVCPMLATKGQQNFVRPLALSGEKILDQALVKALRRIALKMTIQSLAVAIVLTAIYMLITA